MLKLLIGVDVLLAGLFAWRYQYMPDQIPLLYSRPWGESQIVDYWYIFLLPICMHLFYFVNSYISKKFFVGETVAPKIFNVATMILIGLFSLLFIKILFLVT